MAMKKNIMLKDAINVLRKFMTAHGMMLLQSKSHIPDTASPLSGIQLQLVNS